MRIPLIIGLFLAMAALAGCSGGAPAAAPTSAPTSASATPTPSAAAGCVPMTMGKAVDIQNFAFDPATITVSVGETVTWANLDSAPHTVSFDGGPDCGNLASQQGVSRIFDTAGEFAYHCSIHSSMRGTVVVQ